nr:MAG TPA: hypothetical protein [Caudoviricetes sp.]
MEENRFINLFYFHNHIILVSRGKKLSSLLVITSYKFL